MKTTLVIHANDKSTMFLNPVHPGDATIIRTEIGDSMMLKMIESHDRIIMLGHGDEHGLFGHGRHIINSDFVDALRKKECIFIWCYASTFVQKYKLKARFATGMFISQEDEAYLESVRFKDDDIYDSNYWFVDALECFILDQKMTVEDLTNHYLLEKNKISEFNIKQFYSNI